MTDTVARANIVKHGLIDCFEEGLTTEKGELANTEISAVVFNGRKLVFASDKPVPGAHRSSVFSIDFTGGELQPETRKYYTTASIMTAAKYEDFALTPDGRYMIATTGFDRVATGSADLDNYNTLLIWPLDHPEAARVVSPSSDAGITSSVGLRSAISRALDGAPYFKIEGLTTIPADDRDQRDRLLFGIREVGVSHDDFEYAMKLISAPYRIQDGELGLIGDFELVYDYDPSPRGEVRQTVGLSSIEYDLFGKRIFLLTSFEEENASGQTLLGGYLWALPISDFSANKPPALIVGGDGAPLNFVDKPEGLAVLNATRLFLVFDNDRDLGAEDAALASARNPHQAPYAIVELR